jgi:hypothetical protein
MDFVFHPFPFPGIRRASVEHSTGIVWVSDGHPLGIRWLKPNVIK